MQNAHRVLYHLFVAPVPAAKDVLHRCGTRQCVNPRHLYIGTHRDNMRDRLLQGHHPNAHLTAREVKRIRRLATLGYGLTEISRRVKVSKQHAWKIIHYHAWAVL